MKNKFLTKLLPVFLAAVLFVGALPLSAAAANPEVLVSAEEYNVSIDAGNAFISNGVSLEPKVGNKMYMTYTVKSVETEPIQQGVAGCADAYQGFPYVNGGKMIYGEAGNLLNVGYTYFIEFVITEDGFDYTIGRAKGKKSEYVSLKTPIGDGTADMKHMGIWFDAGVKAELEKVHVYNAKGQDLMVATKGASAMRNYKTPFKKATDVPHVYTLKIDEKPTAIYIGNKIKNTTDKMYMEYTVVADSSRTCLEGFFLNGGAFGSYTQFIYEGEQTAHPGDLTMEGASYWIELSNTHTATGWDALIQRTVKGKTEWFKINGVRLGTPDENNNGYSSIYLGEGGGMYVTTEFKDLKIYDANHKNLGVKVNTICDLVHSGEFEDYSNCNTVYYCKDNDTLIATYDDKTVKVTVNNETREGTYYVQDGDPSIMQLNLGGKITEYDFTTTKLIDADKNVYKALGTFDVTFVTGTDTKIEKQTLSPKNGYKVVKPEDPTYKNDTFICWVTSDGKEFDFGSIVPGAITLFAKWKNKAGVTYTAIDTDANAKNIDLNPVIAIGASVIIAALAAVGFVFIYRRYKKQ